MPNMLLNSWKVKWSLTEALATSIIATFFFNLGNCVDKVNDYSCVCNAGFTGKHCDVPITSCSDDSCFPGVPCTENINSISCGSCPSGFTGDGKNCIGRMKRICKFKTLKQCFANVTAHRRTLTRVIKSPVRLDL